MKTSMNSPRITDHRSPVLSCQNLTVGYKDNPVLSALNLAFAPGRFISLLGPNGAGKTTLLRTLSRHLKPLGGAITVKDRSLETVRPTELAKIMAVVLTDKVSPPLLSAFEFAALGRYPHTDFLGRLGTADREVVNNALDAVHALDLSHRPFANLSDGERQKVLVARALAQEPEILLLDEPTVHLDLKHRVEVMSILRTLCRDKGITVVASLHDVDVAAKISDQVALIKSGAVVGWGSPEEVLESRTVADLYDFQGADFDHHLGSIELRGNGSSGRAYVVAGLGSGAVVYRMLAKRGYAITTGIMHTNDLDFYVARSLGADCTVKAPMEAVDDDAVKDAAERMNHCDCVIDTGFDVGPLNRGNVDLLRLALKNGKRVFSLRKNGTRSLLGDTLDNMVLCDNHAGLMARLEEDRQTQRKTK